MCLKQTKSKAAAVSSDINKHKEKSGWEILGDEVVFGKWMNTWENGNTLGARYEYKRSWIHFWVIGKVRRSRMYQKILEKVTLKYHVKLYDSAEYFQKF